MRSLIAIALASVAAVAFAETQSPTPADGTVSVLASNSQQQASSAPDASCCETAKEVRLGPWQARRLSKQAERQEARDCRDCCKGKCECDCCKKSRPTAIVTTKARPACSCCQQ